MSPRNRGLASIKDEYNDTRYAADIRLLVNVRAEANEHLIA